MDNNAYPKPRHAYTYVPRPNQRGYLQYAGPLGANLAHQGAAMAGMGMGMGMAGYYGGMAYRPGYPSYHSAGYGYGPGYGYGYPNTQTRYANYCYARQGYYYGSAAAMPTVQYSCYSPSTTTATATASSPQYQYIRSTPTPRSLPRYYYDRNYEIRRLATERNAYATRRIKPADAHPDDPFWCRERDGQWNLRNYYNIERECYPGRWKMDAERGFLVFHRD